MIGRLWQFLLVLVFLASCSSAAEEVSVKHLLSPGNLIAEPGLNEVKLTWQDSNSTEVTFNVYWSTTDTFTPTTANKIANVTSPFIHKTPDSASGYYYVVTAVAKNLESDASNRASAVPGELPAIPQLSTFAGDGQNIIQWEAVSGAESYTIFWDTAGFDQPLPDNFEHVSPSLAVAGRLAFTHTGLINGTDYYYRVAAINRFGQVITLLSDNVTPQATLSVPNSPANVATKGGVNAVTVQWDPVAFAAQYNLYWSTANDAGSFDDVNSPFLHTGLENGTEYTYQISAANQIGESALSDPIPATPQGEWSQMFDSTGEDTLYSTVMDTSGNIYSAGKTTGDLAGSGKTTSDTDALLVKIHADGRTVNIVQESSDSNDAFLDLALDSNGNVHVIGNTWGDLQGDGRVTLGVNHNVIASYNTETTEQLSLQQFQSGDVWVDIEPLDDGRLLLASAKAVLSVYNPVTRNVTELFPADEGITTVMAVEGHFVYIANTIRFDTQVHKYDLDTGNAEWTLNGFSPAQYLSAIAVSNGRTYVTGYYGDVLTGVAVIAKINQDGSLGWVKEIDSGEKDSAQGVSIKDGIPYIVGSTRGALGPEADSRTVSDLFYARLSAQTGETDWIKQIDGTAETKPHHILVGNGFVYLTGESRWDIAAGGKVGLHMGAFVLKQLMP